MIHILLQSSCIKRSELVGKLAFELFLWTWNDSISENLRYL